MTFTIEQASVEDAPAIGKVLLSDHTSDFLRLQLGTVDPDVMNQGFAERIAESFNQEGMVYVVARDNDTRQIISYAQWKLPREASTHVIKPAPEASQNQLQSSRLGG